MASEHWACVPLGHFYSEFSSLSPTPILSTPQKPTAFSWLQVITQVRLSLPLNLNLRSSLETARLLELERGNGEGLAVLELDWETIKPIHKADITGQLKQPARGNLCLLGLGCQLPPRARGGGAGGGGLCSC